MKRFVSIWFRHLATDWFSLRQPELRIAPFVLKMPVHGRMVITAINAEAEYHGISKGMVLADARAILPGLKVMDDQADLPEKLLKRLAEWCIRFTPVVAIDLPDGLLLDVSGCPPLWGGDEAYLSSIQRKLSISGFHVRLAMADTPGVAWGVARFGQRQVVIPSGGSIDALLPLPPEALRLEPETIDRLHKLGLHQVRQFIQMPRHSLLRRFGQSFLNKLEQVKGEMLELVEPIVPVEPYEERLPCMEPILTAAGIEIALDELLKKLCLRLRQEQLGLRTAIFKCFRVDGKIEQIEIGTSRPTHSVKHLMKLFEPKLSTLEPALGIELFLLVAPKVETHQSQQQSMWAGVGSLDDVRISELIDRIESKINSVSINRYVPAEHYWPERSFKPAATLQEELTTYWRTDKIRPQQVLQVPEPIEVTSPIPDYPPMLFRYKGKIHKIVKADGPERIEQEWWLQQGQHRDYYRVEDEEGQRYWVFRLGHYHDKDFKWFMHGFFA